MEADNIHSWRRLRSRLLPSLYSPAPHSRYCSRRLHRSLLAAFALLLPTQPLLLLSPMLCAFLLLLLPPPLPLPLLLLLLLLLPLQRTVAVTLGRIEN